MHRCDDHRSQPLKRRPADRTGPASRSGKASRPETAASGRVATEPATAQPDVPAEEIQREQNPGGDGEHEP